MPRSWLVHPALFEDAGLRRLMDLGYDTRALLVDYVDVAFRKPCFAGQRMYIWLRAFERAGKAGVVRERIVSCVTPLTAKSTPL